MIAIQNAADPAAWVPDAAMVADWLDPLIGDAELSVRYVDVSEMAALNETYRDKTGPTNVLAFPADLPPGVPLQHLGDVVVCAEVARMEAAAQDKSLPAHWAHLLVHGVLHLLGHDHQTDAEANVMERAEIEHLQTLGFADPYGVARTDADENEAR